jgi:hypothetical protein
MSTILNQCFSIRFPDLVAAQVQTFSCEDTCLIRAVQNSQTQTILICPLNPRSSPQMFLSILKKTRASKPKTKFMKKTLMFFMKILGVLKGESGK